MNKKYERYILFLVLIIVIANGFLGIYKGIWNLFELPMRPWGLVVSTLLSGSSSFGLLYWFDKVFREIDQ